MSALGWVAFLLAAGSGAVARFVISVELRHRAGPTRPWGTFAANVTGCLVAGLIGGFALHHGLDGQIAIVVAVGFAGSLTTFSTFAYETIRLAETGEWTTATTNLFGSVVAGGAAGALGLVIPSLW